MIFQHGLQGILVVIGLPLLAAGLEGAIMLSLYLVPEAVRRLPLPETERSTCDDGNVQAVDRGESPGVAARRVVAEGPFLFRDMNGVREAHLFEHSDSEDMLYGKRPVTVLKMSFVESLEEEGLPAEIIQMAWQRTRRVKRNGSTIRMWSPASRLDTLALLRHE